MATINQVIQGLQIFAKYEHPDTESVGAHDDYIYAGPNCDEVTISDADTAALKALGWYRRPEDQRWFIDA